MKREHLLLGLVLLIIVLLFLVSVGLGRDDGRADPNDSGGIESLQGAMRSLPGFGSSLQAEDVSAGCFNRSSETFDGPASPSVCRFDVPDGIDRLRLGRIEGQCRVEISDQPDTFDQTFATNEWEDGRGDFSLVGEGATVSIEDGPCTLRLNP